MEFKDSVYGKNKIHADPEYANANGIMLQWKLYALPQFWVVLFLFCFVLSLDGMFREAIFPKYTVLELKFKFFSLKQGT